MSNSQPQQKSVQQSQNNKTDMLGIISIILAFTALQVPGLIIGLIGESNAKKEDRSPKLSRIGWILNLVFMIIAVVSIGVFFALIPSHRNKVDDLGRKADLRYFSTKLEEFHDRNGYYPPTVEQFSISTIDMKDSDGKSYVYKPLPTNCVECKEYTLEAALENPENGSNIYQVKSKH